MPHGTRTTKLSPFTATTSSPTSPWAPRGAGGRNSNSKWEDAIWRFETAAHRDAFAASPERFAPQFGGYCAWAVSRGYTADIDPEAWRIVEGKLYLNYSKRVQRMWEQDIAGNIAKGRTNWPGVLAK